MITFCRFNWSLHFYIQNSGYFDEPWKFENVRENCQRGGIVQFGSSNDPFLPWDTQQDIADGLKAKLFKSDDKGEVFFGFLYLFKFVNWGMNMKQTFRCRIILKCFPQGTFKPRAIQRLPKKSKPWSRPSCLNKKFLPLVWAENLNVDIFSEGPFPCCMMGTMMNWSNKNWKSIG